ncbi:hypothetical protein BC828DRAFT_409227 [Blastocladiella britannica]|nr:hypothetical protein BC828DRAFT_409227 [Blastocladiella britannica]
MVEPTSPTPTSARQRSGPIARVLSRITTPRVSRSASRATLAAAAAGTGSGPTRTVHYGGVYPGPAVPPPTGYRVNGIRTAKYTLLTFLPRNLVEQFSKVANMYFVVIITLQTFPAIRTTNPIMAAFPLLFITALTAAKDAYEDWKRHLADREMNARSVNVLRADGWANVNFGTRRAWWRRWWEGKHVGTSVASLPPLEQPPPTGSPAMPVGGARVVVSGGTPSPQKHGDTRRQSFLGSLTVVSPAAQISSSDIGRSSASSSSTVGEDGTTIASPVPPHSSAGSPARPIPMRTLAKQRSSFLSPPLPTGQFVAATWAHLRVGDVVLLRANDAVPADIVLLAASGVHSTCYVETKSLDGETNLKVRHGMPHFAHLGGEHGDGKRGDVWEHLRFAVECEAPNPSVYTFRGAMRVPQRHLACASAAAAAADPNADLVVPVLADNLLLRGCMLRNTDWAVGAIVYTGDDTKIMLNAGETPTKRSKIDREMNPQIMLNFAVLLGLCMTCAVLNTTWARSPAIFGYIDPRLFKKFEGSGKSKSGDFFFTFFSCLVVFQNIVPISLYITTELIKTCHAYFIYSDSELSYKGNPCLARTWNIADDLGQVQFVFSDKTGTLTQNIMQFKLCCIGGRLYGGGDAHEHQQELLMQQSLISESPLRTSATSATLPGIDVPTETGPLPVFADPTLLRDMASARGMGDVWGTTADEFWTLLATCHTVVADRASVTDPSSSMGQFTYTAQSPDEAALVAAARDAGYVFEGRDAHGTLTLRVRGRPVRVELLHVIEFDSSRKRMSVVVRDTASGTIRVYTKGADSALFPRLVDADDRRPGNTVQSATVAALEMFATEGLRTLVVASRTISESEYVGIAAAFRDAGALIDDRDAALAAIAEQLERNLMLLGATAIEDKLQDGVPDAIHTLSLAGVHVWVLTGDKLETAINVGYACQLITPEMALVLVRGTVDVQAQMAAALHQVLAARASAGRPAVLVIDGDALSEALTNTPMRLMLLDLCLHCIHVVCCRVSPLQKAQVVALVRHELNVVTLAIGDGANDVSMIQEADVGIGIAGEEGMQAVMAADFAVGQFRFLVRLMLLHGRWSNLRVAKTVHNFFYKNMTWVFVMFFYQFFAGFSAELMYSYLFLLFYNTLFTQFPALFMGVFDKDIGEHVVLAYPQAYAKSRSRFTRRRFWWYVADALFQATMSFFLPFGVYYDASSVHPHGFNPHKYETTLGMAMSVVIVVNLFFALNMRSINLVATLGISLSAMSLMLFVPFFSSLRSEFHHYGPLMYQEVGMWATVLLTVVVCLLPRLLTQYVIDNYFPDDAQVLREIDVLGLASAPAKRQPFKCAPSSSLEPVEVDLDLTTSPATAAKAPGVTEPPPALPHVDVLTPLNSVYADDRATIVPHRPPLRIHTQGSLPDVDKSLEQPSQILGSATAASATHRAHERGPSLLYDSLTRTSVHMTGFAFSQDPGVSDTVVSAAAASDIPGAATSPTSMVIAGAWLGHQRRVSSLMSSASGLHPILVGLDGLEMAADAGGSGSRPGSWLRSRPGSGISEHPHHQQQRWSGMSLVDDGLGAAVQAPPTAFHGHGTVLEPISSPDVGFTAAAETPSTATLSSAARHDNNH